jgi:diguanylate cyclase (GGDEF)-like protein
VTQPVETSHIGQTDAILAAGTAFNSLPGAFAAIGSAETQEAVPFALVIQAMAVTGSFDGGVFDVRGKLRAAPFENSSETLPLEDADVWVGMPNVARFAPSSDGREVLTMHFELRADEKVAIALVFPEGQRPGPERISALALLNQHAQARALYLWARLQAEEAQAQAKIAHEQQMEMALRLYDLYEEAQNQAITDGLTGLATHDFFQQRLAQEMRESTRYGRPLSFLIFDLDHFKSINDNHGHQAGDTVLKGAAAMLKEFVRGSDLVARYGGEEFAVILPQTNEEDAYNLAERLRQILEELEFEINPERKLKVTASIGVASRIEGDVMPKDLIKRADVALYSAKNAGRNRVVIAAGPAVEAVNAIGAPRQGSQELFYSLARAFAAAIEARIPLMHGHSEAVGRLARKMGEAIGLAPDKQEAMQIAGLLHDVGMMSVPESVIFKPTKLDESDWQMMREHPARGVAILARFSTFSGLLEAVLYHHEKWDGTGYPEGLKGNAIPMGARILSICDSYDAMIRGDYAYGVGVTPALALKEVERCAGTQFDPELVGLFLRVIESLEAEQAADAAKTQIEA